MEAEKINRFRYRYLLWVIGTTVPIYLMITVYMPEGFAGVPWMILVTFLFFCMFLALVICERSSLWNGVIAFLFWMPMVGLHLHHPGTEAVSRGEVYKGVILIMTIGIAHALIQFTVSYFVNQIRPERAEPRT